VAEQAAPGGDLPRAVAKALVQDAYSVEGSVAYLGQTAAPESGVIGCPDSICR
jgi:hypothetical protein